jgi:metal-responsive CopG/Arc/MetJ family transcriptional regulator
MGMAANNISLPEPLLAQIRSAAEAEHRTTDEVLADAVKRYLEERSWATLVEYGRAQAKATGYEGEEGADRAIAEYRAEKRGR